jgi:hypothetical protein
VHLSKLSTLSHDTTLLQLGSHSVVVHARQLTLRATVAIFFSFFSFLFLVG